MCKKLVLMSLVLLLGLAGGASAEIPVDDFESYTDTADLRATWSKKVWDVGTFNRYLDTTGGTGGSQAIRFDGSAGSGEFGGMYKRTTPAMDLSSQTHIRVWQKTLVGGGTTLNDMAWRFSIRDGSGYYYDTERYSPLPNSSTGLSVNGVWGGGAGGGYIDLPLAGYGDGTGADDWYWIPTTGGPAIPDWSSVARIQIMVHSFSNGGSFSSLYDDITVIGLLAANPSPVDGAVIEDLSPTLNWSAGKYAASHDVYFGTDFNDVNDANTSSAEYKDNQGPNTYSPGTLEKGNRYYWRIDEVNGPNTWKGAVWSFATSGYEQLTGDYYSHDPVIMRQGGTYYVFRTGTNIPLKTSTDMHYWQLAGYVFPDGPPAWTWAEVPLFNGTIWAPDISYFNGKYHLYYSISSWASNDSCIGLATNTTLDPCDPNYLWVDSGGPLISSEGTNYNAIDPALFLDEQGQETTAWLSFGSFWTGIKLTQIDIATGQPVSDPPTLYSIAKRLSSTAIEAPFIVFKNGYYHLFVSFDQCCNGVDSTYNIRFGRATSVTGPYSDKDGVSMMSGGGTQLAWPTTRWKGPGHNSVLLDDNGKDWLLHHAYDAENDGSPYLRIHELSWTLDGWPTLTKPNCADVHNLGFGLSPDWTQDCYVDSYDLGFLVDAWLNNFDWQEFADLAGQWLQCNDPRDANCTPNW